MYNLIGLNEAARRLQVNPETLRRWDKKGILKAVRIGSRGDRKYRPEDIEDLINQK